MRTCLFLFIGLLFWSCSSDHSSDLEREDLGPHIFERISPAQSGIQFINEIQQSEDFNIFSYRNFYNGGGVAIGDINNDGLADVYMTGNMSKNKLFLNKGDFQFEDITSSANVGGAKAWSTGVAMVDINADGLLDIYVCNAGYISGDDQENELFINQGDMTFKEQAADYGLNENGYSTHAAFFDYDLDGDLDCYLLNNSFMPVNTLNYSNKRELNAKDWPVKDFLKGGGDKLMRNENGKFVDVSEKAGIYGSLIGFGLGVTVGDVNGDHWPDLYISNDFFERDYLYINQRDGTFQEEIKDWMEHLSLASMGTDMADINNDGYPEIFATEMLPESDFRRKTTTMFENYNIYQLKLSRDFYHQYMQNTLQLNNKDQSFSEIAWYSGVAATDWSWGALMFDADNDGFKDIYVCNGVYRDVTDQDFMNFFANEIVQKMALTGKKEEMDKVISQMPSVPVANKFFRNNGDLTFEDVGKNYGLDIPSFSNGAAYGDLDNDGDLDLIVNNLKEEAMVFRNQSDTEIGNHYLKVQLKGTAENTFAIGAEITLFRNKEKLNFQLVPTRGFQSSVDYVAVFGLGENTTIDSLEVIWPDRTRSIVHVSSVDTLMTLNYETLARQSLAPFKASTNLKTLVQEVSNSFPKHEEDSFVDFYEEGLTMRMLSRQGPKIAVGDVTGDGKDDVFMGSASGNFDHLFIQSSNGKFKESTSTVFERESYFETTAAVFFDADGDGDLDLYAGSGGNNRRNGAQYFRDRLYTNDGKGSLTLNMKSLPENGLNTGVVVPLDLEGDGDLDLFIGSRSIPGNYGLPARSYLFENDGKGKFTNIAATVAPEFETLGMVTDAKWVNVLGDEKPELVVIGEWMMPRIFSYTNGKLESVKTDLDEFSGWWYALETDDVDGDGDQDLIMGNRGENFYFTGTKEAPAKIWIWDFDGNGTVEKIITQNIDGKDMPVHSKQELTNQLVSLKKQNLKHTEYATRSIQEIFTEESLKRAYTYEASWFQSVVAINDGNGQFTLKALPAEVQFSCVCDIYCIDLNDDGKKDLLLGGNESAFAPQFSKLDASFGHVLINQGNGNYQRMENMEAGFFVKGDVKQLAPITIYNESHLLVPINDKQPKLFKVN